MFCRPVLFLGLLLPLIGLAGCVAYPEPPPARSVEYGTYSCDGTRQFVAQFLKDGSQVAFMYDQRTYVLDRGTDGIYRDNTYSLSGGETMPVTVYEDGVPVFENCVLATTQPQYYGKKTRFRLFDPSRDINH